MKRIHAWTPITVDPGHIDALRDTGPGGLIAWHEADDQVVVSEPGRILGDEAMIILGHYTLAEMDRELARAGIPASDEALARVATALLPDYLREWSRIRALTPMVAGLRRMLADRRVYPADRPVYRDRDGHPQIIETYQAPEARTVLIQVATTFAHLLPVSVAFYSAESHALLWDSSVGGAAHRNGILTRLVTWAIDTGLEEMAEH